MPVFALLVAPVVACFVSGFVAAAARAEVEVETGPTEPLPDNVISFDRARRRKGIARDCMTLSCP